MGRIDRMRAFVIRFVYYAIWAAIVFVLLQYAMPVVLPFLLAYFIAFVLKPLINFITRKSPLGRRAVAIIVLTLLYLVLGTLLALLGVRIVVSLAKWFSGLPEYYEGTISPAIEGIVQRFESFFARLDPSIIRFLDNANDSINNAISNIINAISSGAVKALGNIASNVPLFIVACVLTIISSFFFVVDYHRITNFIVRQMSSGTKRMVFVIKDFVVGTLFKFIRAYIILLSITFLEVTAGLFILGLGGSAIPIAAITALVDILPVFGTGTIMIPWAIYQFITGNLFLGIGLLVLYAVITVVRQVLEPRIVGAQIGIPPLLTLIGMYVGARFFGFVGMFGIPVALAVIIYLNKQGEIRLYKE